MKTAQEWFEQLPEPLRTQAKSQISQFFYGCDNVAEAIIKHINWIETIEGHNYWCLIHNLAEANQFDKDPSLLIVDFIDYIQKNLNIWLKFEEIAMKLIENNPDYVSARDTLAYMRTHIALYEKDSEYKINNNISPVFARIFEILHPEHVGFFQLNRSKYDN